MLLASDFSGLAWVFFAVVLGAIAVFLTLGVVTAGVIVWRTKKKRFWFTIPLCSIGWVAVAGLGWWLYELWMQVPTPAQAPAAVVISKLGGRVQLNARHEIEGIDLSGSSISDEALADLALAPQMPLISLRLAKTLLTDAGLQHLKEFQSLNVLDLSETQITDVGLEHLHELKSLGNLWLRDTKVTDDGRLGVLVKLPKLLMLDLMTSMRSSEGLRLELRGAKLTEAGFRLLGQVDRLVDLNLAETPVTDADLELLTNLKLISLDLRHTKVTDAGLVHLEAISTLSYLHLDDTSVTPEGIAKLSEKLPRCAFPR